MTDNYSSYSVVIRTLGTAGAKYMQMLNALEKQSIRPLEIIVVLAEGYKIPEEKLGIERFVFSKKGIVSQRSFGTKEAKGDYILFLDDDVNFDSNMAEELIRPLQQGIADVSFPILEEMLPQGSVQVKTLLTCSAFPMIRERKRNYVRILRSGGWSYNNRVDTNNINYYFSDSAPGTIYMAKRNAALNIRFEEEDWLENYSFSFPDDQINIYKYIKLGYKVVGVSGLFVQHLDGQTEGEGRKLKTIYAGAKHGYIFWHRFIYDNDKNKLSKLYSYLCYHSASTFGNFIGFFHAIKIGSFKYYKLRRQGIKDAKQYLRSKDYLSLPKIVKENYS